MLWDMHRGGEIKGIPRRSRWELLQRMLDRSDVQAIVDDLNSKIDEGLRKGTEIQTSSWMSGSDWRVTPYQPIYEDAARCDESLAAKLFIPALWR